MGDSPARTYEDGFRDALAKAVEVASNTTLDPSDLRERRDRGGGDPDAHEAWGDAVNAVTFRLEMIEVPAAQEPESPTLDVASYLRFALDYIDALPADVVAQLPAMPGFDRDAAETALAASPQTVGETHGR